MYRVFILLLFITSLFSCVSQTENSKMLMYIGTTNNDSLKGIEYCYFDINTGEVTAAKVANRIINPNFLAVDKENKMLFAVGAKMNNEGKQSAVVRSFSVNETSGELTQVSEEVVPGRGPCYVAQDKTKDHVMVAYYGSGEFSAFNNDAGKLSHKNIVKHDGNGPTKRQKGPHGHSIDVDPNSDFIYAADLGIDQLKVYEMKEEGLVLADSVVCHPGAGPRHFDFSPDGKILAVLNELDCSVSTFQKDKKGIFNKAMQTLTLLPDTFTGNAKAADIHFSADGKFLYASNRGFNCIAVFKVLDNKLEFVEFETEGVNWPRNFAIDPSGKFLLVANRDSNNITIYNRNTETGELTILPQKVEVERPICIKFYN
ncbi:lactonase family protein [Labilibacter marinus]|uniref:lactonase family protein n=1 Tax=Labilibacter marinus TaxID=1477105 RepID=UPI0009FA4200|nr:lactonase family protein [Labilibacter marinus]